MNRFSRRSLPGLFGLLLAFVLLIVGPVEAGALASAEHGAPAAYSTLYRWILYLGKFHILLVHFPIAFLVGAMGVQWYRVFTTKGGGAVDVLLWFGAAGAVAAAGLGWLYALDAHFSGDDLRLLFLHRWIGTGTAVLSLAVLFLHRKLGPKSLAIALTLCAGLVAAAAHFGASLLYGSDFLLRL